MITYIPKIIYNSPTELPSLEKLILYYIIHKSFTVKENSTNELNLEINTKELVTIINNSTLELIDPSSQINTSINNLQKIKMSLVDNGFHLKLSPVNNLYLDTFSKTLYITLDPIVIEYLEQISFGNYVSFDLINNSIVKASKY